MAQSNGLQDEGHEGAMVRDNRAPPMTVDEAGMFVTRNSVELYRVAKMLLATGAAPRSYSEPEQVVVAIQALKAMGLNPYVSLRQTGMINGSFTIWGDLPLALVRAGGELEWVDEFFFTLQEGRYLRQCFDNGNCHEEPYGAVCRVKRTGHPVHESVFTVEQAMKANLWGKTGPWKQYPDRMLRYRARSGALKDVFSDGLQGVAIKEYDIEGVDRGGVQPARALVERAKPVPQRPHREAKKVDEVDRMRKVVEGIKAKKEEADKAPPESSVSDSEGSNWQTMERHAPVVTKNTLLSQEGKVGERERMEAALLALRNHVKNGGSDNVVCVPLAEDEPVVDEDEDIGEEKVEKGA